MMLSAAADAIFIADAAFAADDIDAAMFSRLLITMLFAAAMAMIFAAIAAIRSMPLMPPIRFH